MNRSLHISGCLILAILCQLQMGCTQNKLSDSLIVIGKARGVQSVKFQGQEEVTYQLTERYPAYEIILELEERLKEKGWVAVEEDFMNPGIHPSNNPKIPAGFDPSSSPELIIILGWASFIDSTKKPATYVYSWRGQWKNKTGDILTYILMYTDVYEPKYHTPSHTHEEKPKTTDLTVRAFFIPSSLAIQLSESARQFREKESN